MQEKMEANHDHSATGTVQTIHQNFAEVNSIELDSNLPQLPTLADSTCAESVEKHVDAVSPEKIEKKPERSQTGSTNRYNSTSRAN